MFEINPLNHERALDDLKFEKITLSDVKAFQELEEEIEGKYFSFKDRRGFN
jgi:hypothetical protein